MRAEQDMFPPSSDLRKDVTQNAQEIERANESINQARAELRRTRTDLTRYQNHQESQARHTKILWVLVVLVIGTVAGLLWLGSPMMREHRGMLTKFPALDATLLGIGNRVGAAEEKLGAWAGDRDAMSNRMDTIEKRVGSNLTATRGNIAAVARGLRKEWGDSLQSVRSRLGGVESNQREQHDVIANLQNELVTVRTEVAGLREENTRQQQELQRAQQATQQNLAGLDRRVVTNQNKTNDLAYQVDRERIDFDLPKGRTQQVAPDIYLTVKQTDISKQRIQGWLQLAKDGRIVWLRDQGAQNPVGFSSQHDDRSYQLVFTRVSQNGAAGYVLVPNAKATTPVAEK